MPIHHKPLLECDPVRVFVGADESQRIAAKVLEYSIRKHSSLPVEFRSMLGLEMPVPERAENRPRTGFSFQRFLVPKLAGYRGRAIYLDADMQVFGDITDLWNLPFGPHRVLCSVQNETPRAWKNNAFFQPGRQMSVLVLDCARLDWDAERIVRDLDAGKYGYRELMFDLCLVPKDEIGETVPAAWNHLEGFEPGTTKLVHYTVTPMQPWKNDRNPLRSIWESGFLEAVGSGTVTVDEVREGVRRRRLKASLLGRFPKALFFIHLVQELDILLPVIERALREKKMQPLVSVTDRLYFSSTRVRLALRRLGLRPNVVPYAAAYFGWAPGLAGVSAVVMASESSAPAHRAAHRLAQRANRLGVRTYLLQHGFEQPSLTFWPPSGSARIASRKIFLWGDPADLPGWVPEELRARCIEAGCPKEVPRREAVLAPVPRGPVVAVFENLHWERYGEEYRRRFVSDLFETAARFPGMTFLLMPHPNNRWSAQRLHGTALPPNLLLADPRRAAWEPHTAPAIAARVDAVITTPSTAALDAARAGRPVAVVRYGLDLESYGPLPMLDTAEAWADFVSQAVSGPSGRRRFEEFSGTFARRVISPQDACARVLEEILSDAAAARGEKSSHRL